MSESFDKTAIAMDEFGGFEAVWSLIGQMTGIFASIETQLSHHLKECLGFSRHDPTAMAIVGGMRLEDMWNLLKRVMQAQGFAEPSIAYVSQLQTIVGEVKKFRDLMAHRQFGLQRDEEHGFKISFSATNPRSYQKASFYVITKLELEHLVHRAMKALAMLGSLHGVLQRQDMTEGLATVAKEFGELPPLPQLP